eukprot:COSAG06_NODE_3890_length_4801_cov_2.569545_4_plen_131_part_00
MFLFGVICGHGVCRLQLHVGTDRHVMAPQRVAERLAVVSRHVRAGNVTVVAAAATAATATYQPPPAEQQPLEPPARLSSVTGSHVHPSLCVTTQGDILVVWNRGDLMTDAQELLLSHSSDDGAIFALAQR